jgi:hypothetical protein
MNELIVKIKELPDELFEMIMFMAQPRLDEELKKELRIESALILCEQHYNWWYPKMMCYWHLNDVETTYEFPDHYRYDRSMLIYFTKDELKFITKQLTNCGCCEHHSQGIHATPHCITIRPKQSLRAIREMNNHYGNKCCTCPCRHILRRILNINTNVY